MNCQQIQDELYQYLSTEIDPFDFEDYLAEYAEGWGLDAETVADLDPQQLKEFTKWLKSAGKDVQFVMADPIYSPAYLTLKAERKLPPGSWLIHFTNKRIEKFRYGTTIEGMHLSVFKKNKAEANCKRNLSDEIGLYEVVFGFAFDADTRNVLSYADKYGSNAVLFQCDCAVSAYHYGDEERQVIFPLCSEYNLIMVHDVAGGLTVETEEGDDVHFPTVDAVINYVENREGRPIMGLAGVPPRIRRVR